MRLNLAVLVAVLLLPMTGCRDRQPEPKVVDGVAYGVTDAPFRGRWWHYYERGVSWAAGGFHQEAIADYQRALALRQDDARRARTYGMRFVQCFLQRDLAASLVALGRADEARAHLERSIAQAPSAKAYHLRDQLDGVVAADGEPATGAVVVDAVAAAGDGLALSGRLEAAGQRLYALAADGASRLIELAEDGAFAATLAAGETLAIGPAADRLAPVATPTAAPAGASLVIEDPADGTRLRGERLWLRYRAEGPALRALTAELDGRTIGSLPLTGLLQAGTWGLVLEPGEHRLRIVLDAAEDAAAVVERSLVVEPDAATRRAWRAPALLVPLQAPRSSLPLEPQDDGRYAQALVEDGRFRYVDQRADDILQQELALVDAGYLDRLTAAEAGRRLEARYVLTGTMRRGRDEAECYVRLVHSATGRLVATADAYASGPQAADPQRFFTAVAGRLRQAYPVLQAQVVGADSGRAVIDLGRVDGVADRMLFHLVAKEPDVLAEDGSVLVPGGERIVISGEAVEVGEDRTVLDAPADPAPARVVSE